MAVPVPDPVAPSDRCPICGKRRGTCVHFPATAGSSTRPLPPLPAVDPPNAPPLPISNAPFSRERRRRHTPVPGGFRVTDPPLTTRDCADYMTMSTQFIRNEIDRGELKAEVVTVNGRRIYRIYGIQFRAYLIRIGWDHLPSLLGELPKEPFEPTEPSEHPHRSKRA